MEKVFDENSKMGVDQVKTILSLNTQATNKDASKNRMILNGLREPEILATKALLDSVLQSTKDVANVLKMTQRQESIQCNGNVKQTDSSKEKGLRKIDGSAEKKRWQRDIVARPSQFVNRVPLETITLTLEPVSQPVSDATTVWRRPSYYSKVICNNTLSTSVSSDKMANTKLIAASNDESAVRKFQEWHAKHFRELAYASAMNSATSKLKAIAAKTSFNEGARKSPLQPTSTIPNRVTVRPTLLQQNPASGNRGNIGTKRKYFTISNHYFQYLNRPKRARHDVHHIIFKAQVLLDSDVESKPSSNTLFPKTFVPCPSGKTPLPGYKGKRRLNRTESFIPKKKKRTVASYRAPKPKPKVIPQSIGSAPYGASRSQLLPTVKKPRFFPTDKLKWDSVARRYSVQSQQAGSQMTKAQWFTFPSASKIPGSFSFSTAAIKKKLGISGTRISTPFQTNLRHQIQSKTIQQNKIQHIIKDINAILKCTKVPKPHRFKCIEDYTAMCYLFQIRKAMAARAMRFGYVEGSTDSDKEQLGEKQSPVKKPVSHCLVLVSTQTEATLKMWSSYLPRAKELDKVAIELNRNPSTTDMSCEWLHVCKSGIVEDPACRTKDHDNFSSKLCEEASQAWFYDSLSDHELSSSEENNIDVTQCTGGPSNAPMSQVDFRNIYTKSPPKWGSDLHSGVVNAESQNPACSGQGKMQRSLSQCRNLDHRENKMQKKIQFLPQPSYCVRFRMCYCRLYCTCCARNEGATLESHAASIKLPPNTVRTMPKKVRSSHCDGSTEILVKNGFNHSYDFSEQSDVPSIILKASKWDARDKRFRSKSAIEFQSSVNFCSRFPNGLGRSGKFVKKIGTTEIYHKWAVRRFSAPESNIDTVVEDIYPRKTVRNIGFTDTADREGIERKLKPAEVTEKREHAPRQTEESFQSKGDDDMETLFEVVEEVVIDAKRCENFDSAESFLEGKESASPVGHACLTLDGPSRKECLYSITKHLLSNIAMFERESVAHLPDYITRNAVQNDNSDILSPSLSVRSSSPRDMIHKRSRHLSNPIGRDNSKQKHVSVNPDSQSLGVNLASGRDVTPRKNCYSSPAEGSMGNRLRKSNGQRGNSSTLKSNLASSRVLPPDGGEKMAPVFANGLFKASEYVDSNYVRANHNGCRRKFFEKYNGGLDRHRSERDRLGAEDTANAGPTHKPVAQSGKTSLVRNGTERKTRSMSRAVTISKADSTSTGRQQSRTGSLCCEENDEGTENDALQVASNLRAPSDNIRTVSNPNKASKEQLTAGAADLELPVETRSSRRLRSRVNNKRGRYETDYVSDLPKANKKPKRILPTRDYDNEDFWQFYRDHEKTVYSKHLILQSKYIKLLKKKGIKSSVAGCQSALFSSVICASSSIPSDSSPVIPDDGLMSFTRRLTKQRKTPQELPKVADEHCAYCGRSFLGEKKEMLDAHLARHGMRYTMLTAPQVPRKKKKPTKNGRKDIIYRRRNSANNKTTAVPNSSEQKPEYVTDPMASTSVSETNTFEPLPKPSHLTMGHRKQTARKSFSLASALPKDKLIAALECKMRAQSTMTGDKTQPAAGKPGSVEQQSSPTKNPQTPLKNIPARPDFDNSFIEPLPKPHSARKTLTGLPITYSHLNRRFIQAISNPNKSSR